jgi:hypothetical protein
MDEPSSTSMTEQDRQISEIVAEERSRLRNFIRRRVLVHFQRSASFWSAVTCHRFGPRRLDADSWQ